jgi:hypothetical protein
MLSNKMLEEMKKNFEKKTGKHVTLTLSAGAYIRIDELKDILIQKIPKKEICGSFKTSGGDFIEKIEYTLEYP